MLSTEAETAFLMLKLVEQQTNNISLALDNKKNGEKSYLFA